MKGIIALVMVFLGDVGVLIDSFSFTVWIFYVLAMVVLLMLRKFKPDAPRPYKVTEKRNLVCSFTEVNFLICSVCSRIIVGSYLVVAPLVTNPTIEYCYVAAVLFIGFVVYVPFVYLKMSMGCLGNKICFFYHIITRPIYNFFQFRTDNQVHSDAVERGTNKNVAGLILLSTISVNCLKIYFRQNRHERP